MLLSHCKASADYILSNVLTATPARSGVEVLCVIGTRIVGEHDRHCKDLADPWYGELL